MNKYELNTYVVPSPVAESKMSHHTMQSLGHTFIKAQHGEGKPMTKELGCPCAEAAFELNLGGQRGLS